MRHEDITYDFGNAEHHGIFRYTPVRYDFDSEHDRKIDRYGITVTATPDVAAVRDHGHRPELVLKIGDPASRLRAFTDTRSTISSTGALNTFPDHDEFYGTSPETTGKRRSKRKRPCPDSDGALERNACFQGRPDRLPQCRPGTGDVGGANFQSTRGLFPGEG